MARPSSRPDAPPGRLPQKTYNQKGFAHAAVQGGDGQSLWFLLFGGRAEIRF
jgi:hypothetical protein